jgi:glycosyltransferase involved in cell wall biosynthesis
MDIPGGQAIQAARLLAHFQKDPSLQIGFLPVNPRLPGPLRVLQKVKYLRTMVTSLWYGATLLAQAPRYDVLHIFSASYFSFVLAPTPALLAARLYGRKAILNYHSGEAEDHLARWRTAVRTVRLAHRIVTPSEYLVDVFRNFGLTARAIYNIVDTGQFRFRDRPSPRPIFLSNRALEPMYNVTCVLRAFALIQQRYPEASLTVAGQGSQRPALEQLARDLGLRNITFTGQVPPEAMPGLYDAADIFLNAPNIDNMPLSIIESYAAGVPVVTTDAGGISYVVADGETGLVVAKNDHQAMARRAIHLLENPSMALALARRACAECRKYDWEAVGRQWIDLYRELAQVRE